MPIVNANKFDTSLLVAAGGFALANLLGVVFRATAVSKYRIPRTLFGIYSPLMTGHAIKTVDAAKKIEGVEV